MTHDRRRPARSLRRTAACAMLAAGPLVAQAPVPAWWRPDSQPTTWRSADPALTSRLRWRTTAPGVAVADLPVRAGGEGARTRVVIVRLEPARVRLALAVENSARRTADGARVHEGRWTIDAAPRTALAAFNAGQFVETLYGTTPFGWLVTDGVERQPPGVGPLSTAVVVDSAGTVRLVPPSALATPARRAGVAWAFQSYPTLLEGEGVVPAPLRPDGTGIDRTHRDARLAFCVARDGTVLVALTRFDALGPTLGAVPLGLTTPETAALMGALGCVRAVMLDGGISAQLLVRDATGRARRWAGWRRVPLGLVVTAR